MPAPATRHPPPATHTQWEDALSSFKAKLSSGGDVFGPLIQQYLLGNQHRVTVVMLPDSGLAAKTEADERARLDAIRAQLSEEQVRRGARACAGRVLRVLCVCVCCAAAARHSLHACDSPAALGRTLC